MNKGWRYAVASIAVFAACAIAVQASAEMRRGYRSAPVLYPSMNGRFVVRVADPGGVSLREGDKVLWNDPFLDVSHAAVSDDGGTVAVTLWGWKDELGSEAIAFYDRKGEPTAKIPFGMRWVRRLSISPGGSLCALGQNGVDTARVTLYDTRKGAPLWDKKFGLPEIEALAIQPSGRKLLIATRDRDTQDTLFQVADDGGELLWERKVEKNFTYDVKEIGRFSADGSRIELYFDAEKRYREFPVPTSKSR